MNMNEWVKVKLTESGIGELKRQHEELKVLVPNLGRFNLNIDDDGYCKFQLWSLMNELGHLCKLGLEPPFDTEILIHEVDQLKSDNKSLKDWAWHKQYAEASSGGWTHDKCKEFADSSLKNIVRK